MLAGTAGQGQLVEDSERLHPLLSLLGGRAGKCEDNFFTFEQLQTEKKKRRGRGSGKGRRGEERIGEELCNILNKSKMCGGDGE